MKPNSNHENEKIKNPVATKVATKSKEPEQKKVTASSKTITDEEHDRQTRISPQSQNSKLDSLPIDME